MALRNPFQKERKLGVATKRRYDLPLNKAPGTGFLILLICLMTFLAMLALAASFALSAMTDRWSSGLENKVTIEIPAEQEDGKVLQPEEIKEQAARANDILKVNPAVITTHIMTDEEIRDLVRPWLGEDLLLNKVPLPGLITAELHEATPQTLQSLQTKLQAINKRARIDTHEEWLTDLLRFTGALQFAAALLTVVIGITTVTAVAGAVRSRMAVHHAEVELLHLMGASDSYISRQFQRNSMFLAFRGALIGVAVGAAALTIIGWISGEMGVNLLPNFKLNGMQIASLAVLPIIVALIATATARQTVLKVLSQMP